MKTSSAVIILKKISKEELRAFEKYFKRLYFNKEVVWELFLLLKKYYPEYDSPKLERRKVALKLYGENQSKKLTETIGKLTELLKEFLVWNRIKNHSLERDFIQYQIFRERGIDLIGKPSIKKVEVKIEQEKGIEYLEKKMQWNYLKFNHLTNVVSKANSDLLQKLIYDVDRYFLSMKSRLFCIAINREIALKHPFEYTLKKELSEIINSSARLQNNAQIQIFHGLFLLINNPDEAIFDETFNCFKNEYQSFTQREQKEIYDLLQMVLGMFPFAYELKGSKKYFEYFKFGLDTKIILVNGYLTIGVYHTIITACCRLKKIAWMEEFIFDYKPYLAKENKYDSFNLALIRLDFEKKDYEAALLKVNQAKFKSTTFKMSSYVFKAKCLFEITYHEDMEPVQKAINAMKRFLWYNRGALNDRNFTSNHNFLLILQRIIRRKSTKEDLIGQLENIGICVFSEWLREKIELLGL